MKVKLGGGALWGVCSWQKEPRAREKALRKHDGSGKTEVQVRGTLSMQPREKQDPRLP